MTGLDASLEALHFLRPLWLAALLPIAVVWWRIRSGAVRRSPPPRGLAPHLAAALTIGRAARLNLLPIDGIALALALLATGAAGPTWSREPDPFAAQSAPLVVVLRVSPSMESPDIAPSRLERAKQKIRDLLDLRDGARTALVTYAGSTHLVVPMTEDPDVMLPYLEGLEARIMPEGGNRIADALALADDLLARETTRGAILLVTDALDPGDTAALTTGHPVSILVMLPEDEAGIITKSLDGVPLLTPTPDTSDVIRIDRMLAAAHARAMIENSAQPWQDRGIWLAWPTALLLLFWFRRGWTMNWVGAMVLALLLPAPQARADGVIDWFLSPDQQGRIAFERQTDFSRAADLFTDPLWRGYALYRAGRYDEAVTVLERIETAQAAFIQGLAYMKSRGYRDGVRAFEIALSRDPDYPGAAENLGIARGIVDYVERVREQSDTGEDMGIGADEVVFDNEASKGADTQMEIRETGEEAILTTEQWMNTVDTRTSDFLRSRFQLEAANPVRGEASE